MGSRTLFIDADRNSSTGWKGYDYRIFGGRTLQKYEQGSWKDLRIVKSKISGNQLMITIPKFLIPALAKKMNFEFKWSDNMQNQTEPLDWYVNGDAAPGGRFNFIVNE